MKKMKKLTAIAVTVCMALTMSGAFGIGSVIASAALPSYYVYEMLPGFSAWTDNELAQLYHVHTDAPYHSTDNMPAGVEDVVAFRVTSKEPVYGTVNITSALPRNINTPSGSDKIPLVGSDWAACSLVNGKSIVGDKSFAGTDGICFWMGEENVKFSGSVKIQLSLSPCIGPYYAGADDGGTDLDGAPMGYRYESEVIYSDDEGYFFYSFDDDFRQVDWWATDDDGINQSVYQIGEQRTPLPEKVRESVNTITLICFGLSAGTTVYIGDMRSYTDTRVFFDALDETLMQFDGLNSAAFTEASYAAASEVYVQAMDMMYSDPENYTQYEVDCVVQRLRTAIAALRPLFPVRSDTVIAGFDVWDETDLESLIDGGICADVAFVDYDVTFGDSDHTLGMISTATSGAPYYGWSNFISVVDNGDGLEAVKNPFGVDLNGTDGLSFWIKYGDDFFPSEMQVAVGVAGEMEFIAADPLVSYPTYPQSEGYVHAAWTDFMAEDWESDIYDYLDRLDYFALRIPDSGQQQVNIADLYAFRWSINTADFTELDAAVEAAGELIASLDETDYSPMLWEEYNDLLNKAASLKNAYGTDDAIAADMVAKLAAAAETLVPISSGATYSELKALLTAYETAKSFWYGNYSLSSGTKLTRALDAYEGVMNTVLTSAEAVQHTNALNAAVAGLKGFTPRSLDDDIVSFEDYTLYDLDYCTARRSDGVNYSLAEGNRLPDGYNRALRLKAIESIASSEDAPAMAFYPYRNEAGTRVLMKGELVGDLAGLTGFIFHISVSDMCLAKNASIGFGIVNKTAEKPFDRRVEGIPIPASGSGWVYIPSYTMSVSSEGSNAANYSDISAYYFTFDGEYEEGFEAYITGIRAYSGTTSATLLPPQISEVAEGGTYAAGVIPTWDTGYALLDGEPFTYGRPVEVNGSHTLTVVNGGQNSSVTFTVTGGITEGIVGDLDGDESVTVSDALAALRIAVALAECPASLKPFADTDGDGTVTVGDALAILRVAVNLSAGF